MKLELRCPTCARSTRPGLLWLGGGDWVECPDCEGTTVFVMHEERVPPPPSRVFLPGVKRGRVNR